MFVRPHGVSLNDPYVPEAVSKALVKGQKVRYVPRGECETASGLSSFATTIGANIHESQTNAENEIGVIHHTNDSEIPGHPYWINMDRYFEFGGQRWECLFAAAAELVLIEDE